MDEELKEIVGYLQEQPGLLELARTREERLRQGAETLRRLAEQLHPQDPLPAVLERLELENLGIRLPESEPLEKFRAPAQPDAEFARRLLAAAREHGSEEMRRFLAGWSEGDERAMRSAVRTMLVA